jgi:hypothetical protein
MVRFARRSLARAGGGGTVRPVREILILVVHLLVALAELLCPAPAALDHYSWQQHRRDLFELPIPA